MTAYYPSADAALRDGDTIKWPMTFSIWFFVDKVPAATEYLIGHFYSADFDHHTGVKIQSDQKAAFRTIGEGSSLTEVDSSNKYKIGEWNHVMGLRISGNTCILNGVRTNGGSLQGPSLQNRIRIGGYWNGANPFTGRLAHAAIWGTTLTEEECLAVYNNGRGVDPRTVRGNMLKAYYPLVRNMKDYSGGYDMVSISSDIYFQDDFPLMQHPNKQYGSKGAV